MVAVAEELLILVDVVEHMPQAHLGLGSLLADLLGVTQRALLMELLLDGGEELEAVFGGVVLHVLEEMAVDHEERQLLECFHLRPVHSQLL